MSNTTVIPCRCKHQDQDELHGPGMRVHNFAVKAFNGAGGWRCTVCLDLKQHRDVVQVGESGDG